MTMCATLNQLLEQALTTQGFPQNITLESGLRLQVMVHDERIFLDLSRDDSFPGLDEFNLVLAQWPLPVEAAPPKAVGHSGRYSLTTELLTATARFK